MKKAIILASGGMDSLVTTAIAKNENDDIYLLHTNYGQRTEDKELMAFRSICSHYSPKDILIVNIDYLAQIGGNSLTDKSIDVPKNKLGEEDVPNTYVPFRNGNLIAIATSWAEVIGAQSIYIGAVEVDGSGYPDCRKIFYDQLEKANLFLQGIISTIDKPMDDRQVEWWFKNPIGDGGVWSSFVNLVNKYGLVPAEVMPETYHSNNTREISSIIATKLREHGIVMREAYNNNKKVDLQKMKLDALSEIYRILVYAFGEPPTTFSYRFVDKSNNPTDMKTYTPMSFYKEIIEINFDDFVMLMNDPTRPYYKVYEIEYDRNMVEGINWKYLNLPMNEIKALALKSLKDSMPMYFSCDVGKQLNNDIGLLDVNNYMYDTLFNMPFRMDKKQRILTFASGSSHGMNIIGVDTDANDVPTRWLIENSWGNAGYNGKLIMTDKWMDEYLFRLVVNKKYFPAETLKLLEQKPILLPSWDPMYRMDE